ncbi:hypothetical protein Back2_04710 [Nocardioides baekrokdamisoli]|uniref:DUF3071 domain-containing protein n=1 Tax=Nocardioides baekrokdamisoli TaxID=1804624 RepID=A0A3G9IYE2_9ACTN|nr:septation protein SepH [Nocardioides baekrokdamisoli]BBH16184.1 hypothetical protein Back2_04710 [Nocardioides baekrokdamisoli]
MSAEEAPQITTSADVTPEGLTLASVSRDGRRMLFVDAVGREFVVPVDERLRAALPQPSRRTETPMTNQPPALRPKDIQARIRAGESLEQVAAAAGTEPEAIMAFAGPVLAEREHMALRAARASVRRTSVAADPAVRTLQDAVLSVLGRFDQEFEDISWDSWRRQDGRWILLGHYETTERSGIAQMAYDIQGAYVTPENDDARWLLGDLPAVPAAPPATPVRDELHSLRQRRQSVPEVDMFAPTTEIQVEEPTVEVRVDTAAAVEVEAKPATSAKRKRGSIPSWDEIMFGGPTA